MGAEAVGLRLHRLRPCARSDMRPAACAGATARLAPAWAVVDRLVWLTTRQEPRLYVRQRAGAERRADAGDC